MTRERLVSAETIMMNDARRMAAGTGPATGSGRSAHATAGTGRAETRGWADGPETSHSGCNPT
jgi:hypothetical protein